MWSYRGRKTEDKMQSQPDAWEGQGQKRMWMQKLQNQPKRIPTESEAGMCACMLNNLRSS